MRGVLDRPMSVCVIAWRNLWRNRRRTLVTLATVAASTGVLVLFQGLMIGMLHGMVSNLTQTQLGQVQVHGDGYRERPSMYRSVADVGGVLSWADARGIAAAPRSFGAGLVGHGEKSAGAEIWGIDAVRERQAFRLADHVAEGEFVAAGDPRGAVIGSKLARSIGVGVGDELVVVVAAADGSIGNELWRVRGILGLVGERIDRGAVMVSRDAFEKIFVSDGRVHEIALTTEGTPGTGAASAPAEVEALVEAVRAVAAPGDEVASWKQLMPTFAELVAMSDQYNRIFAGIFFLAAAIGILNTMLMAAFERIPEMGLVKALGASPFRVFGEMTLEGLFLSLIGAAIGALIGGLGTIYLQQTGIDTSQWVGSFETSGVVWDPVWRSRFDLGFVIGTPFALLPVAFLAGLYPAITAARVVPVRALRRMT